MTIRVAAMLPHLGSLVCPGDGVLLVSEQGHHALYGAAYALVVPLIDGVRDAEAICTALKGQVDPTLVYYVLERLERGGHIAEACAVPRAEAAFWSGQGVDAAAAAAALAASHAEGGGVEVEALGAADAAALIAALGRAGIGVAVPGRLRVVLTDHYLHPALAGIAASCEAAGQALLLVRPIGLDLWVGPLLPPRGAADYRALAERLALHRLAWRMTGDAAAAAAADAARAGLTATAEIAAGIATLEIARFLAGVRSRLFGAVLAINTVDWSSRLHWLLPVRPRPAEAPGPIMLQPTPVRSKEDGGHRTLTADEMLARYAPLISGITGLIPEPVPLSGPRDAFHVFASGHNPAFPVHRLRDLKHTIRRHSGGKGASRAQARASAIGEALERISGFRHDGAYREHASLDRMRARLGDAVLHPNDVMRFSERQYEERAAWNARGSVFNLVPRPLPADRSVDWVPLWSLSHARQAWLPMQLTHMHPAHLRSDDTFFAVGCSNGLAAGSTFEEAVLQALFELIERDAVALWWYNRLGRPRVDPLLFDDPAIARMIGTAGLRFWALDLTSDLGIPAFAALQCRDDAAGGWVALGFGCHINARIALQRAFAELRQIAMAFRAVELAPANCAAELLEWCTTATVANRPWLAPEWDAVAAPRCGLVPSEDLKTDIEACVALLAAHGLEVLVMDQTHPDVGMPVAKVIVPGLRHFWARYAAGRLYEVPVAMGWRGTAATEATLNPTPVFF